MDTRITKPSHRWLKAPTVHRTALPIRFEVSGASNEGREPETRYRMACAAIAAHQRCCLPGSLKTTDEGLKKKLAWLAFAGKNRGWEKFSVPGSRVFCAVRYGNYLELAHAGPKHPVHSTRHTELHGIRTPRRSSQQPAEVSRTNDRPRKSHRARPRLPRPRPSGYLRGGGHRLPG